MQPTPTRSPALLRYVGAVFGDLTDDYVARHHRVARSTLLAAHLVDFGVENAAVQDFDDHVVRS